MPRAVIAAALTLLVAAPASSELAPGDVAIVGLWSDDLSGSGGHPKRFAFVNFVTLEPFTVVSFTDNGWTSQEWFRLGEGVVSFDAGPAGLIAGTVSVVDGASGNFNLSTSGDQIFAFQGSIDGSNGILTGSLLWGVNDEGGGVWQATAVDANTSALPSALIIMGLALDELDNYAYSGPTCGSVADLAASISDPQLWIGSDTLQPAFPRAFTVGECPIFSDGFEN